MQPVAHVRTRIVVACGMSALAVSNGIGRFAFTPILPLMQAATGLTDVVAGQLAAVNYFAYLIGALLGGFAPIQRRRIVWLQSGLMVSVLTTLSMGMSERLAFWLLNRFVSGLSGGIVFVLAISIVLDHLRINRASGWAGYLYSGVGAGILISGLVVPWFEFRWGWSGAWFGLGLIAVAAVLFIMWGLSPQKLDDRSEIEMTNHDVAARDEAQAASLSDGRFGVRFWLVAAYGCEGIGYIVSATFLVAYIAEAGVFAGHPAYSWAFVGLAAAPSTLLWERLGRRLGLFNALKSAYLVQLIGVMLPVLHPGTLSVVLGALAFGGTFVGIVTLAVAAGRRLSTVEQGGWIIGLLTFVYGIGQMFGAAAAGYVAGLTGGFKAAMVGAALIVAAGLLMLDVGQRLHRRRIGSAM